MTSTPSAPTPDPESAAATAAGDPGAPRKWGWAMLRKRETITPGELRAVFNVAATCAVIGVVLLCWNWSAANDQDIRGFNPGGPPAAPPTVTLADFLLILGYLLSLGACAFVFYQLTFSRLGRTLAAVLGFSVIALATVDFARLLLLHFLTPTPTATSFAAVAPAVAVTMKLCLLLVAVLVVPSALFAIGRYRRGLNAVGADKDDPNHPAWWDRVLVEAPEITDAADSAWRRAYFVPPRTTGTVRQGTPSRPAALCLSGGGVRAACVAMGAMQSMSEPISRSESDSAAGPFANGQKPIDEFDYIISVSGGGYSAGARLMGVQPIGGTPRQSGATEPKLSSLFLPGSPEFEFIRRRSDYIADTPARLIFALGQVLRNLIASLALVFVVPVMFGLFIGWLLARYPLASFYPLNDCGPFPDECPSHPTEFDGRLWVIVATIGIPLFLAALASVSGVLVEAQSISADATKWKGRLSTASRGLIAIALLVAVVSVAVPGLMWLTSPVTRSGGTGIGGAVAGLVGVGALQYGATVVSIFAGKRKDGAIKADSSKLKKLLPARFAQLALVALTLLVVLVAWLCLMAIVAGRTFADVLQHGGSTPHWLYGCAAGGVAALAVMGTIDATSMSLHPFYRARLARTFAVRRDGDEAKGYEPSEATWLDEYGLAPTRKPQFVFAAAAAMSDDDVRPAPGLGCVSYVFTDEFIGGPALGWLKTKELRAIAAPRIQRDLTVQAAVAVSGAAFASAMGRQGKGIQTTLALSGARLGTWLPNPRYVANLQENATNAAYPKTLPWIRGASYFYRELLGINKSDARLAQITDGGHYENLGLVEALRRKCTLIYCIDASGDTPPLLSGLDDALRLAKFELGVEITFEHGETDGEFPVQWLSAGSADPFPPNHPFYSLNSRISRNSVLRARIQYPPAADLGTGPASRGWLIVAKAVLWKELPDWVLTYGADKTGLAFPNDSTSDQFFSEAQFAAYTELGRRIGERALLVPAPTDPTAES